MESTPLKILYTIAKLNMRWIIYCHTNKLNNKKYIGQTRKKEVKYRFGKNGREYRNQPKFYRAIQKYGWDNFEHILLEDNIKTQEDANLKEQYYIKRYNTIKFGYNCRSGGRDNYNLAKKVNQYSLNGSFIKTWDSLASVEDELKIACGSIVKCCKLQLKSAGSYMWRYYSGNCSNISPIHKLTNAKPVIQYSIHGNLIKEFNSAKEAQSYTGILKSDICLCCKYVSKTAGGYVWRYKGESFSYSENKVCNKPVIQYDRDYVFIKEWKSAKEAGRELGISAGNIGMCCRKERNYAGGYRWRYKHDKN